MPDDHAPAPAARHLPQAVLHQLLSDVPDCITVHERDGTLSFANHAAARMLGYETPEALCAASIDQVRTSFRVVDERGAPVPIAQIPSRRALGGEPRLDEVVRFRVLATGEIRWMTVSATPLFDAEGRVERALTVFHDVTDRKRSEDAIRVIAEASALLVESLDYEVTLSAVARTTVPTLADWCGVEILDQATSTSRQVAVAHVDPAKVKWAEALRTRYPPNPDDLTGVPNVLRTGVPEMMAEIPQDLLEAGARDEEHLQIIRELGLHSYMVVPLKARGRILGALTLVSAESHRSYGPADLALAESLAGRASLAIENARLFKETQELYDEARRSSERLQIALDAGRMGAWEWDIPASLVTWSPGLEVIHGIPVGSFEGTLEAYRRDMHPEDRSRVTEALERTLAERRDVYQIQYRIIRPDGAIRWIEPRAKLLLDADGNPVRLVGVCADVTERVQAEETERRLLAEQAARAEAEQFAYVASHDLKEPLRMVASYTQLLSKRYKGRLDADADDFIGFAVDGVARMQTLIDDLLAYSKAGAKRAEPTEVRVDEPLARALLNLLLSVEQSGATVTHGVLPEVLADGSQLTQLFQNLVGNAIKFHGAEPPRIHVSAERNGDEWEISVEDNGIGIPPEYRDRVFIVFKRLHTRTEYPGNGIGLSICKKIVERNGGRIWIISAPRGGTIVRFTLPASRAGGRKEA